MNIIPTITTVADLQRRYRPIVDAAKKSGEPVIIVNHGEPDVVLLDPKSYNTQVNRLNELEEIFLLAARDEALTEHRQGEITKLGKHQKLIDIL